MFDDPVYADLLSALHDLRWDLTLVCEAVRGMQSKLQTGHKIYSAGR